MSLEIPAQPRSTFEEGPSGLLITIPAPRNIFAMLFLPAWLVAWWVGFRSAISELLTAVPGTAFLAVWLLGWTVGGVFAAVTFFWMLVGHERIVADTGVLAVSREIFGLSRKHEYRAADIRRLRVSTQPARTWYGGTRTDYWGWNSGLVAFDYGAKTVRFGAVDEAEAAWIVERVGKRLHIPYSTVDQVEKPEPGDVAQEKDAFWSADDQDAGRGV
jgi:hypothetical protein